MGAITLIAALAAQATAGTSSAPSATATGDSKKEIQVGQMTYVDLEGGVGYSTNPVLSTTGGTGAGFARIAVHAVHTRVTARTTTVLSAYAQNLFYTRHTPAQQSLTVTARHDAAVNEKLRLFGDVDVSYDRGGQLDTRIIGLPDVPLFPGATTPPVLLPAGSDFLSISGRHYRASGHIGAQVALNAREFVNVSSGIEYDVFKGAGFNTHSTAIPVSAGYSRQINARTTVGAQLSARFTDYGSLGTSTVVTPQATIDTSISERLALHAAVGVSFASFNDRMRRSHSLGLAGDTSLCWRDERGHLCARVAISQDATTVAGPARQITAGVDYSRQLNATDNIQFSLSASRYSRPVSLITSQTFSSTTYFRAAADYSRRISPRLFAGVDVSARTVTLAGPDPNVDLSASIFLRYRFGDSQ